MTAIRKTAGLRFNRKGKYVLGLDLGGTKIAVGLVNLKGKVINSLREPTPLGSGPEGVCERMAEMSKEILLRTGVGRREIAGIGIGAGGPLDLKKGMLLSPPNLPGFHGYPLKDKIEEYTGMHAALENDANAAALGEMMFGAGRKAKNLIYMTVSTGIGGGIIVDGKLVHGVGWSAGEVGHMTLKPDGPECNCGNRGCLEALSSGTAIAKRAKEEVGENPSSLILKVAEGGKNTIDAEVVFRAADLGDTVACRIIDEALFYLGIGIGNLITAFSPETVILGGGLTGAGDRLFVRVREIVKERVKLVPVNKIPIVPAGLGESAGIVGAASLLLQKPVGV
ncbi:MAG: ROK family protein [Nitrospiraceae bacterium]|nr:MAG: ROK family protein [Nitrospiraceae bacterium]